MHILSTDKEIIMAKHHSFFGHEHDCNETLGQLLAIILTKFNFAFALSYWRLTRATFVKKLNAAKYFADIFLPNFWYTLIFTKSIS